MKAQGTLAGLSVALLLPACFSLMGYVYGPLGISFLFALLCFSAAGRGHRHGLGVDVPFPHEQGMSLNLVANETMLLFIGTRAESRELASPQTTGGIFGALGKGGWPDERDLQEMSVAAREDKGEYDGACFRTEKCIAGERLRMSNYGNTCCQKAPVSWTCAMREQQSICCGIYDNIMRIDTCQSSGTSAVCWDR